jgi:hypothetical protein
VEAYGVAAELEPDSTRGQARRDAVTRQAREADRSREAEVAAWLEKAAAGELRGRETTTFDAVFGIVRHAHPDTVAGLVEALAAVSAELRGVSADAYLSVVEPNEVELLREQRPLPGLAEAAERLRAGDEAGPADRQLLERAGRRLVGRATHGAPSSGPAVLLTAHSVLGGAQAEALGARLTLARVACEALGWLDSATPAAAEALGGYLLAEQDPARAGYAGAALVRMGGERAEELIGAGLERFGPRSPFAQAVAEARE